jgi:hypothetical protein
VDLVDPSGKTVFLFRADGRLLVRAGGGAVHEATPAEEQAFAVALAPPVQLRRRGGGRPPA